MVNQLEDRKNQQLTDLTNKNQVIEIYHQNQLAFELTQSRNKNELNELYEKIENLDHQIEITNGKTTNQRKIR